MGFNLNILGIRHHGVGSAINVLKRLQEIKPDYILIEGPPEITDMMKLIGNNDLVPPVSIMVYNQDNPKDATFYPFTSFSPEWVAAKYANENNIPIKAIDMPASVSFQLKQLENEENESEKEEDITEEILSQTKSYNDPMHLFAVAAGYNDSEEWWDSFFERLTGIDSKEHFEAIHMAISEMRQSNTEDRHNNNIREAYMRQAIRATANEMCSNIAVICGAWHGPSLFEYEKSEKSDTKLLNAIKKSKLKINCTWIPWTNERLSTYSGYGAGIVSPGWYEHLWENPNEYPTKWLVKVANTFRERNIDVSTAHVIEAERLAQTLAAIRNKATVSLKELNDSTLSVICMGENTLLNFINKDLIVANKIGSVPSDIPKVPLQEDFEITIKNLKLKLSEAQKQIDLDIRNENDLKRSILFHRLEILGIEWAERAYKRSKGTFRESWSICWSPEMMIQIIDKAYLGNTIDTACINYIQNLIEGIKEINEITKNLELIIPAELTQLVEPLLTKISELSSGSNDIIDLLKSVPNLIEIGRYGDVRKSDLNVINDIVANLITKININLANACYGLNEENSMIIFKLIFNLNEALKIYENETQKEEWFETLKNILAKDSIHPIIQGCTTRLLLNEQKILNEEAKNRLMYALSAGQTPSDSAFWIEGFLSGSAMILIYDNKLWNILYQWVTNLSIEDFDNLLPFLRRAFSKFEYGERRQLGEKAKKGFIKEEVITIDEDKNIDHERAKTAIPIILKLIKA